MYKMTNLLILAAILFGFSGCFSNPFVRTEYIVPPKYEFQKVMVDTKYKMSVDAGSKEVQRVCTPLVVKATDRVWDIVEFHEGQIDRYNEYVSTETNASR